MDASYILVGMRLVQKRLVSDLIVMVWACALYYNDCGYCATMVFWHAREDSFGRIPCILEREVDLGRP